MFFLSLQNRTSKQQFMSERHTKYDEFTLTLQCKSK